MIKLVSNSNKIAQELCRRNEVIAFYKAACEQYASNFKQTFITTLQILITKVGIVISSLAVDKKVKISQCYTSVRFLCDTVLENKKISERIDKCGINTKGNIGKHSIKENEINIEECVVAYNSLISALIDKYKLTSLSVLIISKKKGVSFKKSPKFEEAKKQLKLIADNIARLEAMEIDLDISGIEKQIEQKLYDAKRITDSFDKMNKEILTQYFMKTLDRQTGNFEDDYDDF